MKILIAEDDKNKLQDIESHVASAYPQAEIQSRSSYSSALRAIMSSYPDIVLLDMTMPTFDVTARERGGRTRAYAGKEILRYIDRSGLKTRVIIVTQYETFGVQGEERTLEQLKSELAQKFPSLYFGAVYYRANATAWKSELEAMIRAIAH